MKSTHFQVAVLVVCLFLLPAPAAWAQAPAVANQTAPSAAPLAAEVPRLIKFSGTLLDERGQALKGPVGVTFALYAQQTEGAALWIETQNVKPDANGNYTVLLGANSANGVPAELFVSAEARWLGIQVGQQPEHERILLVSVPYALKAGDAETLGGLPASAFVTASTPANTPNSAGAAAATSSSSRTLAGAQTQSTPKKALTTPQAATPCSSVTSDGTATVNSIGLFTAPCNIQSSLMTQTSINGFPGVNVAGNNAGLLLNGTGTHQITVTGATSGRLGQDANGFFFSSDTNGSNVRFLTNNGTLHEWMRITGAGNVGIGTTTPAAKLDVAGNFNLPNTTSGGTAGVIQLGGAPFAHNFGSTLNQNTFLGIGAGNFTMTGIGGNTGIGALALGGSATGVGNTAVGVSALEFHGSGDSNVAAGNGALRDNNTGSANTGVGWGAGESPNTVSPSTTGSFNTFIGFETGPGVPESTLVVNHATAIGANAVVSCSNCMVLGGTGANAVNVGIGTNSPGQKLSVAGTIESTSGGVKFPDGTTQMTAAAFKSIATAGNVNTPNVGVNNILQLSFTAPAAGFVFASASGFCNTSTGTVRQEWGYTIGTSATDFSGPFTLVDFLNGNDVDQFPLSAQRVLPVTAGLNSIFLNVDNLIGGTPVLNCQAVLTALYTASQLP